MANPFYRNHWIPNRHGRYPQAQIEPQSIKPKVINIPVHFVGSADTTRKQSPAPVPATDAGSAVTTGEARRAAAVAIQRAVRGYLVRKNARIVRQVAKEVEEIERRVIEEEAKIRLDARERLLVSETLMALLLRLDSVRGVRDLRKKVIRRVIRLQEAIDSMSAANDGPISSIDQAEEDKEGLRDGAAENSSIDYEKSTDQTPVLDEELNEGEPEFGMSNTAALESPERISHSIETGDGTISTTGAAEDREVSRINVAEEVSMDHEDAANQTVDLKEEINKAVTELEMEIPVEVELPEKQSDLITAADVTVSSPSIEEETEGSVEEVEESSKGADQTLDLDEETNEREAEMEEKIRAAVESPKRKSNPIGNEIVKDEPKSPESDEIQKADEEAVKSFPEVETNTKEESEMREMVERMAVENGELRLCLAQLFLSATAQHSNSTVITHTAGAQLSFSNRLKNNFRQHSHSTATAQPGQTGLRDELGAVPINEVFERVEQLERVVHHRMDRRKKRRSSK